MEPTKMAHEPAAKADTHDTPAFNAPAFNAPAFNAIEFSALSEMIGEDGVMEMVDIFEAETGHRLRRLAAGGLSTATLVREMHTLKGAAGTVASPRLTALGWMFEQAAREAISPTAEDLAVIAAALAAYLAEVRVWSQQRERVG
jgi:HPt (histidine-containing phosphotransfer) domain-containing protein